MTTLDHKKRVIAKALEPSAEFLSTLYSKVRRVDMATYSNKKWLFVWIVFASTFSAVYWALGPYSYIRVQDNGDAILLYAIVGAQTILEHGVSFWLPALAGGVPAWAQPALENLLVEGIPFMVLPPWAAHGAIMWLQRFFASYFTFRLCRDHLNLGIAASVFAGLCVPLNEWTTNDYTLYHGLAIPGAALFIWCLERLRTAATGWIYPLGFALGLAAAASGWLPVSTPFLCALIVLWFAIARPNFNLKTIGVVGCFLVGASVGELSALFGYGLYSGETLRGAGTRKALPFIRALEIQAVTFWRDVPLLIVPVILFGLAVVSRKRPTEKMVRILLFFTIVYFGAKAAWIFQTVFAQYVSVKIGFAGLDWFKPLVFTLLGAVGLDALRKRAHSEGGAIIWRHGVNLITICVLVIPLFAATKLNIALAKRIPTDNYTVNYRIPAFEAVTSDFGNQPFRVVTAGTALATYRSRSGETIHATYPQASGFETADGYFSLHYRRYIEFWRQVIDPGFELDPKLKKSRQRHAKSWLYLFEPMTRTLKRASPYAFSDRYNLNLLSLANTRFIFSKKPLLDVDLKLVYAPRAELEQREKWIGMGTVERIVFFLKSGFPPRALYVYENPDVLPRVFVTDSVRSFASNSEMLAALGQSTISELRTSAFVHADSKIEITGSPKSSRQAAPVIAQYSPDRLTLEISAPTSGVLVVTNNYDPSWVATVDGKPRSIIPVYHTFQGIVLGPGDREVVLEFRPVYRLN